MGIKVFLHVFDDVRSRASWLLIEALGDAEALNTNLPKRARQNAPRDGVAGGVI
jgi:hypothetical protein